MKIKKDDNVIVMTGKDKGKTGKVLRAFPKKDMIIVAGVNIIKAHKRPTKSGAKGQIVDKTMPIHVSNVMIADPKTGKPSRIRIERGDKGRVRISAKSSTSL
jgi:large subunit ribosomal protein L24